MRLMNGRYRGGLWGMVAPVLLFVQVAAGQTVSISDNELIDGNWTHYVRQDSGPGNQTVTRQVTSENPTGYAEGIHTWSNGALRTAHVLSTQTYTPSAKGPIGSVDISFAFRMTDGSANNRQTQAGVLLLQGGQTYVHASLQTFSVGSAWGSVNMAGLAASDFGRVGAGGVEWSVHPDFSCAGGEVAFGYTVVNTSTKSSNSVTWSADDFVVTIHHSWTGDCNANGISDECDITSGHARDSNNDGTPDECQFVDISAPFKGVSFGMGAWGDYDSDGDLDVAITGSWSNTPSSIVYRNDGNGAFTESEYPQRARHSALAWGDYDRDGDLDLVVSGLDWNYLAWVPITRLHRNDNGSFTEVNAGLANLTNSAVAWGDYDNDGDLDLAIAGDDYGNPGVSYSKLYRNEGWYFVEVGAGLWPVTHAALAWGDYDNDGDLDLALSGYSNTSPIWTRIYQNSEGMFNDINANLVRAGWGSLAWGDYDADGDLDLAVMGREGQLSILRVYRNDGGQFVDINAGMTGDSSCSVAWGDYDNDGDLDLAVAGETTPLTTLYRNDGADAFTELRPSFAAGWGPSVAWGDYDGDGDLDLLYCGGYQSKIYRNDAAPPNTPPTAPSGLIATCSGSSIAFGWQPATDVQTPSAGLSYNLRVGTKPGGNDVVSGMADSGSGLRRVPALGNAQQSLAWTIKNLPGGVYYWSVQAIDGAFAGSSWAPEQWVATAFSEADFNQDGDVDYADFQVFQGCAKGPAISPTAGCEIADFDDDVDVDQSDFGVFQRCYSGANLPAIPSCTN